MPAQQMQAPPPPGKPVTKEWRKWEGVNVRDSRTAIGDTEFSWLENAITIGAGAIQILPREGDPVATLAQGIATIRGFRLNGLPVMIAVGVDGSLTQVSPFGTVTVMAPAGTVTIDAECTIWQGTPILIIDPTFGYFSWNGTTFTAIDPTITGEHIAVFQGRVWISKSRNITYTAPLTFNNFSVGDGAGSTNITDEAFQGDITALVSALEQLWIVGDSAVEALSNVQAFGVSPTVLTTFSISNVVSSVGSLFTASVLGYFRALVFASPFGVYALSGVTPQKISEKLDDFPFGAQLGPVSDVPAAIAVVQNTLAVLFLVSYAGDNAIDTDAPVPLIAGFVQGKWFFASQGNLLWITTVTVNGVSQAWGTDGTNIYQLFGADTCTPVSYKVQSKLYDHGSAVTEKAMLKLGIELRAQPSVASQDILCILNNPVDAGTEWTRGPETRANQVFPAASVFVPDDPTGLTVFAFHLFDGAVINPMQYDVSVDGGETFPVQRPTTYSPAGGDVVSARTLILGSGVRRFLTLHNGSQGIGYSDDVMTLPTASTWATVTPPGSAGAPLGFEVRGLNVVYLGQDGGGNIQLAYSLDGGATFLASATMPAGVVTTPLGYQIFASPVAGTWLFINPQSGIIYRSTDSGANWSAAVKTITAGNVALPAVASIFAASASRIVAVYRGQVCTSDDAGLTWTDRQNLTLVASSPVSILQGGIGYMASFGPVTAPETLGGVSNYVNAFNSATTRGAMWRSTNLGTTWAIVNAVGGGGGTTDNALSSFPASSGRGVIDLWDRGATARHTWFTEGVATAPVCMTLLNDDGDVLTITQGSGGCPPQSFSPQLFAQSETASVAVPVYGPSGIDFIINTQGRRMTLLNDDGDTLTLISGGLSLSKSTATIYGHYLGWMLQGTDPPFRIEAAEMEYAPTREWDTSP